MAIFPGLFALADPNRWPFRLIRGTVLFWSTIFIIME
jgi:hypothetical protein